MMKAKQRDSLFWVKVSLIESYYGWGHNNIMAHQCIRRKAKQTKQQTKCLFGGTTPCAGGDLASPNNDSHYLFFYSDCERECVRVRATQHTHTHTERDIETLVRLFLQQSNPNLCWIQQQQQQRVMEVIIDDNDDDESKAKQTLSFG